MNALPVGRGGGMTSDREDYPEFEDQVAEPGARRPSPLVQLGKIAWRRKWAILSTVVGSLVVGLVVTLFMTPLYTASVTVEIQRETQNFTNVEGAEGSAQRALIDPEYYQTQYGLLKARSLADRVAGSLRLSEDYRFFKLFKSGVADKWFADGKLVSTASTRADRIRVAGDILLSNVRVKPERQSRLVDISFTSPDPAFSKRVIDAWATNFMQAALERKFETTAYARKFLEDRLAQLRTRIDDAEHQLVAYAAKEGIVNLPSDVRVSGPDSQQPERSLAADDLATLNRELSRATADRILAESRLGASGGNVAEALGNQALANLRGQRADLAAQYAKLINQFQPSYPPAQALQSQVQQLDRAIAAEETRVRRSLDEGYRSARNREQQLSTRVASLKSGVLDLRRRSIQYNVLEREVDTSRQLYDGLLQRYKEIGIAGGVGVNNIAVIDGAELPVVPSSPFLLFNLALSLLIGILLGGGLALLLEQLNDSVDDPAEIADALGAPLLGTLPKVLDKDVIEALKDPKEVLTEAYVSLRTSLSFTTDHGFPRSLAVTSSRPAEGKSTTSYAIANSLARPGRRVVLIDADMRSPSVHEMVGVSGKAGLSNYLSGSDDIHSLVSETALEGLFVLAAGPQPPSAADLLSGDRFERLVELLLETFDHVVIDAPPVMGLADAPLIASHVEGTVFVIEAHATGKSVARVAISRLRSANTHLLGVIVSKFDTKRAHYGYGYDYGYGYGYGQREDAIKA